MNFNKYKRYFQQLEKKEKKKIIFLIVLILSLLFHILVLFYFEKFAFLTKIKFPIIKSLREEDEKPLKITPQDTKVIFVPDAPVKTDQEEEFAAEKIKFVSKPQEAITPIEEIPQTQEEIVEQPKEAEKQIQEQLQEKEIEKEYIIPDITEAKKEAPKKPVTKKDEKTIDKETLRKLAMESLLKPKAQTPQDENVDDFPNTRNKEYTSLLLPKENDSVVVKMKDFIGIGESMGINQGNASIEQIKQQTKMMCFINKLFKELMKNFYMMKNYKEIFVFTPNRASTLSILFTIDKQGKLIKCIKNVTYFPPIPDHLESQYCENYIEIDFIKKEARFGSRLNN